MDQLAQACVGFLRVILCHGMIVLVERNIRQTQVYVCQKQIGLLTGCQTVGKVFQLSEQMTIHFPGLTMLSKHLRGQTMFHAILD